MRFPRSGLRLEDLRLDHVHLPRVDLGASAERHEQTRTLKSYTPVQRPVEMLRAPTPDAMTWRVIGI